MNACRMEKGYRHWGDDISVEDTNLQAGLGFTVAWDKPVDFIGKEALLRQKAAGAPHKRLLQFRLKDTDRLLYKEEPVWVNGARAGAITSGMYGHRVEASLGMGYVHASEPVTAEWIAAQRFEIEIALVDDEQRRDVLEVRAGQEAVDDEPLGRGRGGDHHRETGDVGGNGLRAAAVVDAFEHVVTRQHRHHHGAARGVPPLHAIAAHQAQLPPAHRAMHGPRLRAEQGAAPEVSEHHALPPAVGWPCG